MNNEIIIYQAKNGAIELREDTQAETIWASQVQIADLFGVERSVVTKHIRNILNDEELSKNSVCAKFAHTAEDGKIYQVQFYNLDVILAVGYRTSSARAIQFRQWATAMLRSHIIHGYTINPSRIDRNYQDFLKAVEDVKKLLPSEGQVKAEDALELIKLFADTWFSLDAFDKSDLPKSGLSKRQVIFTADELGQALAELKKDLLAKQEASELFAQERQKASLEGIVGNVFQSVFGRDAYPTPEEKAAHLLYFIIKNHPFTDGNKRSGAFTFVWYLQRSGLLDSTRLTPEALTVLTLLIAESDPKEMQRMIGLVLLLLRKKTKK